MNDIWQGILKLRHIQLTNFRQFRQLNMELHERLTVLIGENGSGKTTVLEALERNMRLFAEFTEKENPQIAVRDIIQEDDINNESKESRVEVVAVFERKGLAKYITETELDGDTKQLLEEQIGAYRQVYEKQLSDLEDEYKDKPEIRHRAVEALKKALDEQIATLESHYTRKEVTPNETITWQLTRNRENGSFSDVAVFESIRRAIISNKSSGIPVCKPFVKYYPSRKLLSKSEDSNLDDPIVSVDQFTTWYRRETLRAEEKKEKKLIKTIEDAVYNALSDQDGNTYNGLRISYQNIKKPDGELWISKNGKAVKVSQLSSGETTLFLLVTDIAKNLVVNNPNQKSPLKNGTGIVLIDEIDLHLHPSWQRKVIPQLLKTFEGVQFVVTTHSPLVLAGLSIGSVFLLAGGTGRTLKIKTYGKDINRILELIMGVASRDEDVQEKLDNYLSLIERDRLDEAETLRAELERLIGTNEPIFIKADGIIKRKQLIGR
jgi:predicted ATP-binding protein involved in virulence